MTGLEKGSIMNKKTKEKTMKTRKVLALAGVTLLAAGVLAACSGAQALKVNRPLHLPTRPTQIISTI